MKEFFKNDSYPFQAKSALTTAHNKLDMDDL